MSELNPKLFSSFEKILFWLKVLAGVGLVFGVLNLGTGFYVLVKGLSVDPAQWGKADPVHFAFARFLYGGVELFLFFLFFNYGRVIESVCKMKKEFLIALSIDHESKIWRALALLVSAVILVTFVQSLFWIFPLNLPK